MAEFASSAVIPWRAANQHYLDTALHRLRLLLQRRVLWLRSQWHHDPMRDYQAWIISDAQADWLMAGEDLQAEDRFYHEDAQATALREPLSQIEVRLTAQRASLQEAGQPLAIDVLAHLFGLTSCECDVLLLCLAPELDATFERLYAYVQDDVTRKYATPHLALALCTAPSTDSAAEPSLRDRGVAVGRESASDIFLPEAPLRRFRLVVLEPGPLPATPPSARSLRLDDRIADYLRGVNRLDARLSNLLQPMPPALLAPVHLDLVERVQRRLAADTPTGRWPLVNLIGPPETGKRGVASAVCSGLGLHLAALQAIHLPAPGSERQEMLRLLERDAVLLQMALYIDASDLDRADKTALASLQDLLEHLDICLLLGSREPWQTTRTTLAVPVPKLDTREQHILWQQVLGETIAAGQIAALVQQFDLGPTTIARAASRARDRAQLHATDDGAGPTANDLWQACRELAGWHLEELAQNLTPVATWEDIVLPLDVLQQLQEIAAQVAHRAQVYDTWGFGARLSRGRGISALFAGPSGTGKTMAAEVLAQHLQLDLYRIDLAGVVSKYIGETEKNLRRVFDTAEQSGAILFFDEADALFGKRTEVKDSHDRYANIEINYLLQRMEDYRGLAILATNMKSHLDPAFLRRLRFIVNLPFPDAALRRQIWQKAFPASTPVTNLDYTALARLEIPGGNIKNIVLNAAFLAATAGQPVSMEHVVHATQREYAKIDKLMAASEFGLHVIQGKR